VHPPTAKLLIAVPVHFFGYKPWAWRLAPALAGTLLAGVFFLLARLALPTERAALLATGLLLLDGVYLVQSRIAMTNVFAVLFQLLSALLVVRAASARRLDTRAMLGVGLALGLALSTRWTSLWAWGFLGLVFLALRFARRREPAPDIDAPSTGPLWREAVLLAAGFFAVPALVYLLSYVPWMAQTHPHTATEWWKRVEDAVRWQKDVWDYHAHLTAGHAYYSRWYTWPFLYRPTWYFWESGHGIVRGIVALGNPAIWWASLPASLWALVTGIRSRQPRLLFAGAGFFFLYLPWGLSPRTLNFSHYLFEAIPYACLSLGALLDREWDTSRRPAALGYVALAAALFVLFLPFLTALPVPEKLWALRFPAVKVLGMQLGGGGLWTWFPSWI
jgi:dolichyl-phosphate-mannose--protein O-mannosyl transferase